MDMVYVKTATFVHCMVSGNKHCSLSLQQYEYTAAVNALSRELLDTWLQYAVVKALHEVNAVEWIEGRFIRPKLQISLIKIVH